MFLVSYLVYCWKLNNIFLKEYMFFGIDFIYKVQFKVLVCCRGYLEFLKECFLLYGWCIMNIGF